MSSLDISERESLKMAVLKCDFHGRVPLISGKYVSDNRRRKNCHAYLRSSATKLGIEALGFDPTQKKHFLEVINRPQCMLLVTGPTGSGKTVTLYTP